MIRRQDYLLRKSFTAVRYTVNSVQVYEAEKVLRGCQSHRRENLRLCIFDLFEQVLLAEFYFVVYRRAISERMEGD